MVICPDHLSPPVPGATMVALPTSARPVAPGLPLLGSLRPMIQDPLAFLVKSHAALGPVFSLRVLHRRFVVLAGAEANHFMASNERTYLCSRPTFEALGRELGGSLFLSSSDGDMHKRLRSIQTPSYSGSHVENRLPEVIEGLRRRIGAFQPDQRIDGLRLFQLLLTEQIGLLIHNDAAVADHLDDLVRLFRFAVSVRVTRQLPRISLLWPAYQRSRRRVLAYVQRVVENHRNTPKNGRQDLVDDALDAVARGDLIKDENLGLLTLGPLFAGNATANTGAIALFSIIHRPEIYQRVMREVEEVFAHGDSPPWEAFKNMKALRYTLMETLRLYPPAYLAARHVANTFTFGGHTIEAGEEMFMATAVSHFSPELFPNPYEFDIDRYSDERREHTRPGAYAPWGTGAHTCLGNRFAQWQLLVTIATLLHTLPLAVDPPNYRLKVQSRPVTMPVGIRFRINGKPKPSPFGVDPWPNFSLEPR